MEMPLPPPPPQKKKKKKKKYSLFNEKYIKTFQNISTTFIKRSTTLEIPWLSDFVEYFDSKESDKTKASDKQETSLSIFPTSTSCSPHVYYRAGHKEEFHLALPHRQLTEYQ